MRKRSFVCIFFAVAALVSVCADPAQGDLTQAAFRGDVRSVRVLLKQGADVNAKNDENITALFMASYKGHINVVKILLEHGAETEIATKGGHDTALIVASQNGHLYVVKALLKAGADVNAQNNRGATSLILASAKGYVNIVRSLLDNGADIGLKTYNDQMTALEAARTGNHSDIVRLLEKSGVNEKAGEGKKYRQPAASDVIPLVSFKKYGIKSAFICERKAIAEEWPAVFPSGTKELAVVLNLRVKPGYRSSMRLTVTTESGKNVPLKKQKSPWHSKLGRDYFLFLDIFPAAGVFKDGVYYGTVRMNRVDIAKIKWRVGTGK